MLHLFIDKNTIKVIQLKKTILGQQETSFYEKNYETDLLIDGKVSNIDLLASAIKEVMTSYSSKSGTENQVFLVLPQESFYFMRTQAPSDIAPTAMNSFIADKARALFPIALDDCLTATFVRKTDNEKVITFFGIAKDNYELYVQALNLIDLKITSFIPDTLAYFKLFEKTLRSDKRENILYLTLEKESTNGYLFDSYGLLDEKKITIAINEEKNYEEAIKEKVDELASGGKKLNRIILSGEPSDKIRQDTFTKHVGAWTNPLKRIVPTFYEEYIKQLVVEEKRTFPLLTFDGCFGAFIFSSENKDFSFLKNGFKTKSKKSFSLPKISLPKKEILLFAGSFILSFALFFFISKIKLPAFNKKIPVVATSPTPLPTATPTPTPIFKKEEIKIKILNGGGIKGKANEVKALLKEKGYQEIITDNADNFDYEQSEIQVKKSFLPAVSMMQNDLKDYLKSYKQSTLEEDSTADLILIVGQDFK